MLKIVFTSGYYWNIVRINVNACTLPQVDQQVATQAPLVCPTVQTLVCCNRSLWFPITSGHWSDWVPALSVKVYSKVQNSNQ